jgi:hypothetical protein
MDSFISVDTNILVTAENGQSLQQKINKVMNELQGWFNANSLILNTEKTTAKLFYSRQERDLVSIWTGMHIKSLSSKLNKACYMQLIIRSIYFAYFHTHLKYG